MLVVVVEGEEQEEEERENHHRDSNLYLALPLALLLRKLGLPALAGERVSERLLHPQEALLPLALQRVPADEAHLLLREEILMPQLLSMFGSL